MATFTNAKSRGIGTVVNAIGGFAAASATTVIGLTVANTTLVNIKASVSIFDGTNETFLVKNMDVVPGQSQVVIGGEQKVVLLAGESVRVISDTATSIDAVMSLLVI